MSGIRINISKLSEGFHDHSLSTQPSDIGLDARFSKAVDVKVRIEKANRQLFVQIDSKSSGLFVCDRCLEEFERSVDSHFSILYVQGQPPPADAEKTGEEIQYLPVDANIIDLGEDIRQYMILSIPWKSLCKEDCSGLCPVCGTNRNKNLCRCSVEETDPRWADLKRFLNN